MAAKKKLIEEPIVEKITESPLGKAIHDYMMPYSEYIILERALPRVEDGLKPVQRRILYTMNELNMRPDGPYKKSARVVGDCLGKYHPHGDSSIYGAMVNLAQDFNMRNTLVNGHGNFGSIDNDPPAAMRYTEVKLEPLACELLRDLDKDTVKMVMNFDDSLKEPDTLPGRFPNLLVNGSTGIAIGLATKIPPHNLTEVIDGTVAMIDNPRITLKEMLGIIKGPDFPTGAFIVPGDSFEDIYATGRGKFVMRAKTEIEYTDNRQSIVITELPYNVIKSDLLERIKDLREDNANKKDENGDKIENALNGIQEISDESDRTGIRAVIRLKKGEDALKVLDYLYKKTDLQCNFNVNMVAIADGRPQQLGLLAILKYYIEYQRQVIFRRTSFDMKIAKDRAHILEGFAVILPAIEEVVAIIKGSNSRSEAKEKLRARFDLSEKQADAILDLKLVNLTRMEVTKIENELADLQKKIAEFEKIVGSKTAQLNVVKKELLEIRDKYRTKRLTAIVDSLDSLEHKHFDAGKLNGGKRGYVVIGTEGEIKFVNTLQYLSANRASPDSVKELSRQVLFVDRGQQTIVFGNLGNVYRLNFDTIIEHRWNERGDMIGSFIPSDTFGERCVYALNVTDDILDKELYVFTKKGMVKKTLVKDYVVNKDYYQGIVLKDGDEVVNVELKRDECSILFVSSDGMCVNSSVEDYPVYGRKSGGVIGMVLDGDADVVFAGQADNEYDEPQGEIILINNKGYAKRVIASEIELSKRARKGVKVMDTLGGTIIYAGWVTNPYDIALVNGTENIFIINSEDVLIDRNRPGKGKPFAKANGCVTAVRNNLDI